MQIRPHERKKIITSGIFIFIMLLITGATIFILGKERAVFEKKTSYFTQVNNAQNLKTGAFIQFKGIKIGTIQKIEVINLEKIRISFNVKSTMSKWVRSDSYMMFRTEGVLGDKFLEILGGSSNSPLQNPEVSIETRSGTNMQNFITKGEDIVVTASRVLQKLDRMLSAIDDNLVNDTLINLNGASKRSKDLLYSIEPSHMKKLSSSFIHTNKTMSNLSEITKTIKTGPGTANSLIYDKALYEDIKTLLGGANRSKVLKYFIRESIEDSED